MWACGRTEIVALLLKYGANVNADDDYALRYSAQFGYIKIVTKLLENNADVHAHDDAIFKDHR